MVEISPIVDLLAHLFFISFINSCARSFVYSCFDASLGGFPSKRLLFSGATNVPAILFWSVGRLVNSFCNLNAHVHLIVFFAKA